METAPAAAPGAPRLRRTLTLWDLIFYGIVLIQPIAPVPLYGVAQKLSDGHFVTIILIALFAMLITAVSYGRMGALYPTAGSAYTYVGRGLNPHLGFLAGWAMILDYLLQPLDSRWGKGLPNGRQDTRRLPRWSAIAGGICRPARHRRRRAGSRAAHPPCPDGGHAAGHVPRFFPALVFHYYLVFVLPVAALVVRDPDGPPGAGIFDQACDPRGPPSCGRHLRKLGRSA